jgi:molybdopterin converting factor subunit 1
MNVTVKFFAILKEKTGVSQVSRELPAGSTVADLWQSLQQEYPRLAVPGIRLLYAVNQEYVTSDRPLHDHDEVVFIPPVSGGTF